MTTIKGILFDKDGTIMSFHSLWINIAIDLVTDLCEKMETPYLKRRLLAEIGIIDHRIMPDSILAAGTTKDMTLAFQAIFNQENKRIDEHVIWIEEQLYLLMHKHVSKIEPTTDVVSLFTSLKNKGIKLGIATADDQLSTSLCLKQLNAHHFFDFVGTSDIYKKKPDPHIFQQFCNKTQLTPEEVVVVGDNITDLVFALNAHARYGIGVLSGTSQKKDLEPYAHFIIPTIQDIIKPNGLLLWETESPIDQATCSDAS
ncbi:HAD family hydrolase [Metabacillus herbersteinensis]|uniref:HAD family hydrolase n=1 Tax=Metabacillus herbersteinensis TaxID=283816 RepID=A0ABV6GII9_9BACI